MGPAATVDFYDKLVRATPAAQDQNHLRVVIWGDPTVPNRQEALLGGGTDPTPWLEEGIARLVAGGAEIIVSPCNTAHAFLPPLMEGRDIEFLSIIDAAVEALPEHPAGPVGLLATDGALATGLYQDAVKARGMQVALPSPESQQELMDTVYAVKRGESGERERKRIESLVEDLQDQALSCIIAGCTEVSVLLQDQQAGVTVVDPSEELVQKTIRRARTNRCA
jgi:aspartate racemase